MTFSECADAWYKRALCGTTYSYQREIGYALNHLKRHIGKKEVSEITWLEIEDVMFTLATRNPNTKKPASKKLLRDIRNCANNIMYYAIDCGEIQNNPVRMKKLPRTVPSEGKRALTMKERELVLKTEHRLKLPAYIMLFAGLRPNEVIPLEFNDFDEENSRLIVNKSVSLIAPNEYTVKSGTKNGKSRFVTIPKILIDVIQEEKRKTKSNLITSQINGDLHTPTSWRSAWNSYRNALNYTAYNGDRNYFNPNGIPRVIEKITPYMFRHTYATMLYTSGVDLLTAKLLMGHANISTTLNFYTHLEEETRVLNIQKYNEYISENFSKSNV